LVDRIVRSYGTRALRWLGRGDTASLGAEIVPGLYEAEARYLMQEEWALNADDILRRRSKLALHVPPDAATLLNEWIARQI
jgi:glycerol-3-phosphate dehydrogenase